jgi:leucyl aminopeptidase
MATLTASNESPTAADVDVLVIAVGKGADGPVPQPGSEDIDAALSGRLAAVLADLGASGDEGEVTRFASLGAVKAPVIAAVGLGEVNGSGASDEVLRKAAGSVIRALAGRRRVALSLPAGADVRAAVEGAALAAYSVKQPPPGKEPVESIVVLGGAETSPLDRASVLAESVALARELGNLPANLLPPAAFADRAVAEAAAHGVETSVLDETELAEQGFGGIIGVGQGSVNPPRLVRLSWTSPGATRTAAFVGKGITFDSGGLSLKPSTGMEYMKVDMAGAAAVLGAVLAAARLKLPINVTGWLAIAENMPSARASRPTDVLTMYGGKRVEVLNTDAEGRLILADAIVRACEDRPDYLDDMATLTGAQLVALGSLTAAVMANDDALRDRLCAAAERAGELAWPMPLPKELRKSLDSDVADIANMGDRYGGMLVAGLFLADFVADGTPWAHIDMAGPAFNQGDPWGYTPRGGTGAIVRTIVALAEDIAAAG